MLFSNLIAGSQLELPWELQLPVSHRTLGGKAFLWQKYPGKEISQLLNYQITFLEMSTTWNISHMKTRGGSASFWSDCDLSLLRPSKMSSQHVTCRNQGDNLYRHAQRDKRFQGMRLCALHYGRKTSNGMLCSQSPKEILKQCEWHCVLELGHKEARLSPPLLALPPREIQLAALCFSVFWPNLVKTIEIPCKNALC